MFWNRTLAPIPRIPLYEPLVTFHILWIEFYSVFFQPNIQFHRHLTSFFKLKRQSSYIIMWVAAHCFDLGIACVQTSHLPQEKLPKGGVMSVHRLIWSGFQLIVKNPGTKKLQSIQHSVIIIIITTKNEWFIIIIIIVIIIVLQIRKSGPIVFLLGSSLEVLKQSKCVNQMYLHMPI